MRYFIHPLTGALLRSSIQPEGWTEIDLDQYICILEGRAGQNAEPKPDEIYNFHKFTPIMFGKGYRRIISHDVVGHTNIGDWLKTQEPEDVVVYPVIEVMEKQYE